MPLRLKLFVSRQRKECLAQSDLVFLRRDWSTSIDIMTNMKLFRALQRDATNSAVSEKDADTF